MEKKEYTFDDKGKEPGRLEEPVTDYGIYQQEKTEVFYDIPEAYLLMRLKQVEKEMAEGKGIPHEGVVKRFLG